MKTLILLLAVLASTAALAIPEQDLRREWRETVLPFFDTLTAGELRNRQGLRVAFFTRVRPEHRKVLVVLPGRTEPARKYAEVLYDLRNDGFDLVILDHQGQGDSERLLADTQKGHVVRFDDYVRDLEQLMAEVVRPLGKDVYVLAHSMGGTIAARYLNRNPGIVKKAVLAAPMLQINTDPYNETVARAYARLLVLLRKGATYAPGRGPYVVVPFPENTVTHSEVRYEVEPALVEERPELAVGGPTARWVRESLKVTRHIDRARITTPVLLLQAGEELVVVNDRQNSFCRASFCRMIRFPSAKHEILMETDAIRDRAFAEFRKFLND
jgi:lysophospholipase